MSENDRQPNSNATGQATATPPPVAAVPDSPAFDPQEVAAARREIQQTLADIRERADSAMARADFFRETLSRVVAALAAKAAGVWLRDESGNLGLACEINLRPTRALDEEQRRASHDALLRRALEESEGLLLEPHTRGGSEGELANPTDFLLVLAAFQDDSGTQGVLEIVQRPDAPPSARRGYLRFVKQVCRLVGDYLKQGRLRQFSDKQSLWQQLDDFAARAHASLDVRETCYAVANEGRRLLGCDRVNVVVARGRRARVEAISGQATFERRSNVVRRLEKLAAAVMRSGEAVSYTGDRTQLAPQVEKALDAYLDLAHARAITVLPLADVNESPDARQPARGFGALIVEQLADSETPPGSEQRLEAVARHSSTAIGNALAHDSVFLLPLWRLLGRARSALLGHALPKTIAVAALLASMVASLVLVPADFTLQAKGELQPAVRRQVFAGIDGVVTEVAVEHGDLVRRGDLLARMQNTDLQVQIADVIGRRQAAQEQIIALERTLLGDSQSQGRLSVEEQNRLAGQLLEQRRLLESLARQLELYREKERKLQVLSPIDGQVITWQIADRLLRRPVRQGQILLTVADPEGAWELEVHMPEDRMGHVAQAAARSEEPLAVSYILATEPGTTHQGRIKEIHAGAEVRGEEGNTVLVRVAVDKHDLADLRPGASVTAKVHCGQRSLGYVMFHDVVAFVQKHVLFRF